MKIQQRLLADSKVYNCKLALQKLTHFFQVLYSLFVCFQQRRFIQQLHHLTKVNIDH